MWFFKNNSEQEVAQTKKTALLTVIFVIIFSILILAAPVVAYQYFFAGRIFQGVSVDGISLSGLTSLEAEQKIQDLVNKLQDNGLQFVAKNKSVSITPSSISIEDPDLTYELIDFDIQWIVDEAYSFGRRGVFVSKILDQIKAIFSGANIKSLVDIQDARLIDALKENFKDFETTFASPELVFNGKIIEVTDEKTGVVLDYQRAIDDLHKRISLNTNEPFYIFEKVMEPEFTKSEVMAIMPQIERLISSQTLEAKLDNKKWNLTGDQIKTWIKFAKKDNVLNIVFDELKLNNFVDSIALEVDDKPTNAVLEFSEDKTRVTKFIPPSTGDVLDKTDAIAKIKSALEDQSTFEDKIDLITAKEDPSIALESLNELGIKELIATGESDYAGSPKNRRHNIATGARSFNGVVIPPGEEFSALRFIGDVNEKSGYLPELVIKGNETKPEFGGGLCQVSTTMFRAALAAGLEITRRANHSYTVTYYSPIGTDATIYDPAPDFRFKNDTANHILVHTVNDSENSKLYFEIWGTKDGRTSEMTTPVTYDRVSPPPTKIVETTDLPVGKKKCTERPHAGMKAYFDRIITFADGTKKEQRFNSNYRPWQEVCLIGVEKLSTEVPADPAITSPDQPVSDSTLPENPSLPPDPFLNTIQN